MKTKQCKGCGETFPATTQFFTPQKERADGLRNKCKPCMAADARKRRKGESCAQPKAETADWSVLENELGRKAIDSAVSQARYRFAEWVMPEDDIRSECTLFLVKRPYLIEKYETPTLLGYYIYSNAVRKKMIRTDNIAKHQRNMSDVAYLVGDRINNQREFY